MSCAYCSRDSFRFYKPFHLTRSPDLRVMSKSSNGGMCHQKCSHLAPIVNTVFTGDLLNRAFCSHEFGLTEERKGGLLELEISSFLSLNSLSYFAVFCGDIMTKSN